jgi:hypothetical protein
LEKEGREKEGIRGKRFKELHGLKISTPFIDESSGESKSCPSQSELNRSQGT